MISETNFKKIENLNYSVELLKCNRKTLNSDQSQGKGVIKFRLFPDDPALFYLVMKQNRKRQEDWR